MQNDQYEYVEDVYRWNVTIADEATLICQTPPVPRVHKRIPEGSSVHTDTYPHCAALPCIPNLSNPHSILPHDDFVALTTRASDGPPSPDRALDHAISQSYAYRILITSSFHLVPPWDGVHVRNPIKPFI
jgi:hypothetical protein